MSHESWLTWVRTLVNESWLMTHVSQINPKWAKSIWVGKIPIQNVWEKPPYRVQNVWERNPHTKCMREKSPFKMYEKNPHTKCMRDLSPLYFVWEADCDFGRSPQMLPSQNKSPWPIKSMPKRSATAAPSNSQRFPFETCLSAGPQSPFFAFCSGSRDMYQNPHI
jgi:hypothetical protein